jgi:hypothetical protein
LYRLAGSKGVGEVNAVRIDVIDSCRVDRSWLSRRGTVSIGGMNHRSQLGKWCFYVPKTGYKILHAVGGLCHCVSPNVAGRDAIFAADPAHRAGRHYTYGDWQLAYSTPVLRRVAENFVISERLAEAGLGPKVRGFVVVQDYTCGYAMGSGSTAGLIVDDLTDYPVKAQTRHEELLAIGVVPDRILSCLRQQIRGYVADLNSVVAVHAKDAEEEVAQLTGALRRAAETEPAGFA